MREQELYAVVAKWATRHFGWFASAVNKGTELGRVDVVGLRQAPGDHSADTDVMCIEVKRGTQPLLSALGQAVGYSIYGDFCFLAEYRPDKPFSDVERDVAQQLGVGLIRISRRMQLEMISSARRCTPVQDLRLRLADQMGYVQCTICRTFFPRSHSNSSQYDWSLIQRHINSRSRMRAGIEDGRGFVFWPFDAAEQDKSHKRRHLNGKRYNRRFLCNTCADLFVSFDD